MSRLKLAVGLIICLTPNLLGGCAPRSAMAQEGVLRSLNNSETEHLPKLYYRRFFLNRGMAPRNSAQRNSTRPKPPRVTVSKATPLAAQTADPVTAPASKPIAPQVALAAPMPLKAPQPPEPPQRSENSGKWGKHRKEVKGGEFALLDVGSQTGACSLLIKDEAPVRIAADDVEWLKSEQNLKDLNLEEGANTYLIATGNNCDNLVNGTANKQNGIHTSRDYGVLWVDYNPSQGTFKIGAPESRQVHVRLQPGSETNPKTGTPLYRLVVR